MLVTLADSYWTRMLGTQITSVKSMNFETCRTKCEQKGFTMIDARRGCHTGSTNQDDMWPTLIKVN